MTFRPILHWPNFRLKESSKRVVKFDQELVQLTHDLYDTLNIAQGAGLAAPQIGVLKRVIILKCSLFEHINDDCYEKNSDVLVLVNPELELSGEDTWWEEQCLSLRGITARVARKSVATLKYHNLRGEEKCLIAKWPFSGALQHECDHLDGVLFIDRLGRKRAQELKKKLHRVIRGELSSPKKASLKPEKKLIDTRLSHGPGKRKKGKRKKGRRKSKK